MFRSSTTEFVIRCIARIGSLATLLFVAAIALSEGGPPVGPTPVEWIGIACFPGGVLAGLLIAWRRELPGAAIALGSLVGFYIWHLAVSGRLASGPWFVILTSPAFLFLTAALLHRRRVIPI